MITPYSTDPIINTATVSSTTPDPNLENNTSTVETGVEALADVSINKTASRTVVSPGDTLTYTLIVTNRGPSTAENVVVTDAIPSSILNPMFSVNGVPAGAWTGSFTIGSMPMSNTVTITITGTVDPNINIFFLTNTATVNSTTPDPDLGNNTSTVTVDVQPAGESADISVSKTAAPTSVRPGESVTYTLVVTNHGPNTAVNVILTDDIPSSVLNPMFSVNGSAPIPWTGVFIVGDMPSGSSKTITITGTVDPNATSPFINTATVSSQTFDPNLANNTASVRVVIITSRCQALTDIIQSVALQEAALAKILDAEGKKLQAIIAFDNVTAEQLLKANASVTRLIGIITRLENLLLAKVDNVNACSQACI